MRFQRMAACAGIAGPVLFVATFLPRTASARASTLSRRWSVNSPQAPPGGFSRSTSLCWGCRPSRSRSDCTAVLLRHAVGVSGPAILAVNGVAAVLAGAAFPLRADAMGNVYDPGGHQSVGTAFFATAAIACLCLRPAWRGIRAGMGSAPLALTTGVVGVACFVLMGTLVIPDAAPLQSWAGLAQRAIVILVPSPDRAGSTPARPRNVARSTGRMEPARSLKGKEGYLGNSRPLRVLFG